VSGSGGGKGTLADAGCEAVFAGAGCEGVLADVSNEVVFAIVAVRGFFWVRCPAEVRGPHSGKYLMFAIRTAHKPVAGKPNKVT
jgi:hypothetical protein